MSELFADREALIQWAENWAVEENLIDGDPEIIEALADALLASGVVRPLPDEETVREKAREHVHKRHPEWHDRGVGIVQGSHYRSGFEDGAAWALALFMEGAKE